MGLEKESDTRIRQKAYFCHSFYNVHVLYQIFYHLVNFIVIKQCLIQSLSVI